MKGNAGDGAMMTSSSLHASPHLSLSFDFFGPSLAAPSHPSSYALFPLGTVGPPPAHNANIPPIQLAAPSIALCAAFGAVCLSPCVHAPARLSEANRSACTRRAPVGRPALLDTPLSFPSPPPHCSDRLWHPATRVHADTRGEVEAARGVMRAKRICSSLAERIKDACGAPSATANRGKHPRASFECARTFAW